MNKISTIFIIKILLIKLAFCQSPKVLFIGLDGCRPDALMAASTPNIDGLIANATYSMHALTRTPTVSGPGWSSMTTGVWHDKHGVTDNSFAGANYINFPHFFNRIETINPDLYTASFVNWSPINNEIVDMADLEFIAGSDQELASEAAIFLQNNDPDVLFVAFDEIDGAGHSYGFHPAQPGYLDAIETADTRVGSLLNVLNNRPNIDNEDWIVIITTDHGGTMNGHGGNEPEQRILPFIVSGNNVPDMEMARTATDTQQPASAIQLNGSDEYIQVDNPNAFDFGTSDFTIECRVKTAGWNGDPAIISNKDWNSGANAGFVISTTYPSGPQWKVNIGDGNNRADIAGGNIDDDQWHHLAVSFDRDGLMTAYQDGIYIGQADISNIGNIDAGLQLVIGQDGTLNYPNFFQGMISEVRIWNMALEEDIILEWMCSQVDNSHPNWNNLTGYWKLNEGNGNTFTNLGSGNTNATFAGTGSPNWTSQANAYTCFDYSQTPRLVDASVTALTHLCIPIDPQWQLDGNAVGVECAITNVITEKVDISDLALVQDFVNNSMTINLVDLDVGEYHFCIYDLLGRIIYNQKISTNYGKINIPLDKLDNGVYIAALYLFDINFYQTLKFYK